jgi:hypothetical protein
MSKLESIWRRLSRLAAVGAGLWIVAAVGGCSPGSNAGGGSISPASFPGGGAATFTEPTQSAFTVSLPQGWTAKGGVQQGATGSPTPWMTATSPDGATTISLGDPSIPGFTLPSPNNAAGQTVQSATGVPSPVEAYENGVQFAGDYAQQVFAPACSPLQGAGTQAEPEFAQLAQTRAAQFAALVGVPAPPTQFDGGSARFTCQSNGAAYAVGVIAVTGLNQFSIGGFWNAPVVIGYRTPAASQAQTDQIARAMLQSYQPGAQWRAQMAAATKQRLAVIQQQGAQAMAALQQQDAQSSAMLNANEQAANDRLNAGHAAFMAQFNAQGDARNAGWQQQQYDKQTGQQSEMRYINNQQCVAWYDAAHTRCSATAPN